MPLKKVVVIGPESTGKSTLCEALARHYQTGWVREYAREYLLTHGMRYTYADLTVIARGQLALEDAAAAGTNLPGLERREPGMGDKLLFVDTDLYVIKVWSEYVFGRCETPILKEIAGRRYDAYLLCRTDLPWVKDELREYPDLVTRDRLFHIYRDILVNQNTPWMEIGGGSDQRIGQAIAAVDRLLQ